VLLDSVVVLLNPRLSCFVLLYSVFVLLSHRFSCFCVATLRLLCYQILGFRVLCCYPPFVVLLNPWFSCVCVVNPFLGN